MKSKVKAKTKDREHFLPITWSSRDKFALQNLCFSLKNLLFGILPPTLLISPTARVIESSINSILSNCQCRDVISVIIFSKSCFTPNQGVFNSKNVSIWYFQLSFQTQEALNPYFEIDFLQNWNDNAFLLLWCKFRGGFRVNQVSPDD